MTIDLGRQYALRTTGSIHIRGVVETSLYHHNSEVLNQVVIDLFSLIALEYTNAR